MSTSRPSTFWSPRFRVGWILILIAALNALGWTLLRWSHENALTGAELTMDYDDTRTMADAYRVAHPVLLKKLKENGISNIALYDMSLANLRDYGRISILGREEAVRLYPRVNWKAFDPNLYHTLITTTPENQPLIPQLMRHLKPQAPPHAPAQLVRLDDPQIAAGRLVEPPYGILLPASRQLLNDAQVGFDPQQVKMVRDAGLRVTARLSNPLNLNMERVQTLLDEAKNAGAHVVIFAEDEVLGYSSLAKAVAREMKKRDLVFGNIEFSKQRGWQEFAAFTEGELVRVHSVGGDEAARMSRDVFVERFSRAVKERNIRVAYIRFARQFKGEYVLPATAATGAPVEGTAATAPLTPETSALEQNLAMIRQIHSEVSQQPLPVPWLRPGLRVVGAQEFGAYPHDWLTNRLGSASAAKWLQRLGQFLSGLGGLGAGLLMLNLFFDLKGRTQWAWLVLGVAMVGVLSLSSGMGAKLMALEIGCLFSAIALLWGGLPLLWDNFHSSEEAEPASVGRAWLKGIRILLQTSLLTIVGTLLIMALLNNWKYLSGTDKYLWPKGTQLVPLGLVALAFIAEAFPHRVVAEGAGAARERLIARIRALFTRPLTIGIVVGTLAVLVVGMIWIARTGNDSGMEVSGLELQMRSTLEEIFITRPRTKEIFLGHPAMIFAVWFAVRRQWLLAFGAALATTIGQADMLNTFSHLHMPIFYSVLRSFHALWIGIVLGGIGLWLWSKLYPPLEKTVLQWSTSSGESLMVKPVAADVNGRGYEKPRQEGLTAKASSRTRRGD